MQLISLLEVRWEGFNKADEQDFVAVPLLKLRDDKFLLEQSFLGAMANF